MKAFWLIGTIVIIVIALNWYMSVLSGAQANSIGNFLDSMPWSDKVQSSTVYSTKVNGVGAKDMLKSGNGLDSMAQSMGAGSDWK